MSSPRPREFAAIDLGSNSFHMIVARIVNGSIQILSRIKRKVRLAEGLGEDRMLNQAAITRGVECLALFAKRLQGFNPENVKVVGTYTLRRALNSEDFLAQAKLVFPFPIQIISGSQEAKLIYAGVSHTQPEKGRKLVVDIGGGSTEMTIGDAFTPLRAESRHMGCVSFAKRFFPQGVLNRSCFEQAYQTALEKIEDLAWEYRELGWENVLGSSGTIKTVSKVLIAKGFRDGLITEDRLNALIESCLEFPTLHQIELKGLIADRADVLVPGLAILLALFHTFHIQSMRYSDGALREGIMYSWEQRFQVDNIRQRTLQSLVEQFDIDQTQAERVKETAQRLFTQVKSWKNPKQTKELGSILKWASLLHEIGISINHKGAHRHAAYMVTNLDLPGFDPEQQHLLALLLRFHLKGFTRSDLRSTHRFQHRDILTLVRLLRLAVILNRGRQASPVPKTLLLNIEQHQWQLDFEAGFLKQNPLIQADLEEEKGWLNSLELGLSFNVSKGL